MRKIPQEFIKLVDGHQDDMAIHKLEYKSHITNYRANVREPMMMIKHGGKCKYLWLNR